MSVIVTVVRAWIAVATAVVLTGCGSPDSEPDPAPPGPAIDVATMRAALLRPADIGPTWVTPGDTAAPGPLVSFCAGDATAPPVPPGSTVVNAPLVDEGAKGAQTLNQTALVYRDTLGAEGGTAAFRAVAAACPETVDMPATDDGTRSEPAYTETVRTSAYSDGGWSGFVLLRHKRYDPAHPAVADTAVVVLAQRNVVLVDAYAVYRLGVASTDPSFATDWPKLVSAVLGRVPG
jgi:hypothetical protein